MRNLLFDLIRFNVHFMVPLNSWDARRYQLPDGKCILLNQQLYYGLYINRKNKTNLQNGNAARGEELHILPAINASYIVLPSNDRVQYKLLTNFGNDAVCITCVLKHRNRYWEEIGNKCGHQRQYLIIQLQCCLSYRYYLITTEYEYLPNLEEDYTLSRSSRSRESQDGWLYSGPLRQRW